MDKGVIMNSKTLRRLIAVEEKPKKDRPHLAIERDSKFVWTIGADVMKTFKRHGFVPPTEYRDDYLFKINREMKNDGNS
jgi:hypothetical protein